MKVSIVQASEVGDDLRASSHIHVPITWGDMRELKEIDTKRTRALKRIESLNQQERNLLAKYDQGFIVMEKK